MNLNQCEKNIYYVVERIEGRYIPISRRLTELGFIYGASLKILQFSALKKTLLIEIDGYVLSMRATSSVS